MIRALTILAAACAAALAVPAAAKDGQRPLGEVEIHNTSEGDRKFCVFALEKWKLLPQRCFRLKPDTMTVWIRGDNPQPFRYAVYEPRPLFDKLLRSGDLPGDVSEVRMAKEGRFGQSRWKPRSTVPPRPEYRVKFCNRSQAEPVWLTIAVSGGQMAMAEGYWSIERGECTTINYSERFMRAGGGYPDDGLLVMYRAFTTGENGRLWSGTRENEDPDFCVNTQKQFTINPWIAKDGNPIAERYLCDKEGETWKRFRYGPTLDKDVQIGKVDF
ncbi:DUF1036 domain-containing protein [Parerythrobacter aestuarii]|uniref:DUF1036 domain-containing protein n=1 Tax=Parerythrobacter aestuarii TaxID=3020909 RepID=UPI0024DEC775|nr:DUF1036 domain-containing protein [Parerythrobacter aestuarii]